MSKLLKSIAETVVHPDLLRRAAEAGENAREAGDDTPIEFVLLREFGEDKLPPAAFAAIMFRMTALAQLLKERAASSWVVEVDGTHHVLVADALFVAAAQAKLLYDERSVRIDPAELLELALAAAEPEGRG